jgi:hypothetical protein
MQAEVIVNSQAKEDLWNALLDAEMNDVYWSHEAQRHGSRDRVLAATAAIVSSGTVLALFASFPNVGKAVVLLSSVVSIIHAAFFHTGRLKQVAILAARWRELAIEYRSLWSSFRNKDIAESKVWSNSQSISRREKSIDESAFRVNEGRLRMAQDQVLIARGLKHE